MREALLFSVANRETVPESSSGLEFIQLVRDKHGTIHILGFSGFCYTMITL